MNKSLLYLITALFLASCEPGKMPLETVKIYKPDTAMLEHAFERYREPLITNRRFKHQDIEPLILKRRDSTLFKVDKLGESVQHRALYQLSYGTGGKKIMLWSQMHGNESTATMALFDLLNFLEASGDEYEHVRSLIREKTTLYFLPMINPDGAEVFNRRNALDIDLNRDARQAASPEARILKAAAERNKPSYGFNLHDQQIYYNVPGTPNPATISVLAPAYNHEREVNDVRTGAMQLIVGINSLLQRYIPDGVARYNDAHEPRGFGDNFQKWGARTILIESGGYKGDPEKQYIRKLNFIIILNALIEIAQDSYHQYDATLYDTIPENAAKLSDLLITNIRAQKDSIDYFIDLAIKRDEINAPDSGFYVRSRIDDVGDLKDSYGYEELDAQELTFMPGKVYPRTLASVKLLDQEKAFELLKEGYIAVKISNAGTQPRHKLPILLLHKNTLYGGAPTLGIQANFFLARDGKPVYAVVNGYLVDLQKETTPDNLINYMF